MDKDTCTETSSSTNDEQPADAEALRFPVFEVPPGTPMIPASRIQNALDEDGIV